MSAAGPDPPALVAQDLRKEFQRKGEGTVRAIDGVSFEASRGELLVPFVPAARRFYLPQWVAFDADGQLLVHSTSEAEAHVASMQRFLTILGECALATKASIGDDTPGAK